MKSIKNMKNIDAYGTTDAPVGEGVSRRNALSSMGKWSIGLAVTAAGVVLGSSQRASASTDLAGGCCNLAYSYYCSGQAWSQGCGNCLSSTDEVGYPTGKWWWTCRVSSTQQRFCGECYYGSCSYTYVYTGGPVRCNSN